MRHFRPLSSRAESKLLTWQRIRRNDERLFYVKSSSERERKKDIKLFEGIIVRFYNKSGKELNERRRRLKCHPVTSLQGDYHWKVEFNYCSQLRLSKKLFVGFKLFPIGHLGNCLLGSSGYFDDFVQIFSDRYKNKLNFVLCVLQWRHWTIQFKT